MQFGDKQDERRELVVQDRSESQRIAMDQIAKAAYLDQLEKKEEH